MLIRGFVDDICLLLVLIEVLRYDEFIGIELFESSIFNKWIWKILMLNKNSNLDFDSFESLQITLRIHRG